jgi:hypothetical protein
VRVVIYEGGWVEIDVWPNASIVNEQTEMLRILFLGMWDESMTRSLTELMAKASDEPNTKKVENINGFYADAEFYLEPTYGELIMLIGPPGSG